MPNKTHIQFSQPVYSAMESEQATITLNRRGNLNNYADVEVWLDGGSAQQYSDYDSPFGFPQIVSFQPGEDSQTIELDIFDDGEIEGIETVNFKLQNFLTNPETFIASQETATLEISDFDPSSSSNEEIIGFETGDFSGWNVFGDTYIETVNFGVNPMEGDYQALLTSGVNSVDDFQLEVFAGLNTGELDSLLNGNATEGSAIMREFTVEAGDTINFDWNFLTNEGTPSYYNDFAFVAISDGYSSILADTNSQFNGSSTNFNQETGYETFSYQFPNSGTFSVGVGVADTADKIVDSALLVDNFSIVQ